MMVLVNSMLFCDEAIAQAYADGAASVDITSDNQAVADEDYRSWGYGDGAASVDITCEFDEDEAAAPAYADGAASVDITSDNQAVADEAYGWGYGDGYNGFR